MANEGKIVIELVGKDLATQQLLSSLSQMSAGVKQAESSGTSSLNKLNSSFGALRSQVLKLATLAGVGLGLKGLWSDFKAVASEDAGFIKMSARLNTTVEDLTGLGIVARKSGMDTASFYAAIEKGNKTISNAVLKTEALAGAVDEFGEPLEKGARTLDELGLKAEVLNKMPLPEKLKAISAAMRDNIAPADQSRIALELFGKAGGAMVVALKAGPEQLDQWIARAEHLGMTLGTKTAEDMAKASAAASDLTTSWKEFGEEIVESVAPALTGFLNLLTEIIVAARKAPPAMAFAAETAMQYALDHPEPPAPEFSGSGSDWAGDAGQDVVRKPPKRPGPLPAKGGGGGGGGGGAADKGLSMLLNQIDQLEKEYDSLTEGLEAGIDKSAARALDKVRGVEEAMQDPEAARARGEELVALLTVEKKKKAETEYNRWLADIYHDTDYKIYADEAELLQKHSGDAQRQAEIVAAFAFKKNEERRQQETEILNLSKGYYDTLAGLSPVLAEQLGYKTDALRLEKEIAQATLERDILEKHIPPAQADQLRGLLALTNAAKNFNLEKERWAGQGLTGGLRMGAYDLGQTSQTWQATQVAEFIKNAPKDLSTSMASTFIQGIKDGKTDLMQLSDDLGYRVAESLLQKWLEGTLNQIIPALSNGLANIFSGIGGGGGGGGFLASLLGGGGGGGMDWDFMYSGGAYARGDVFQKFGRGDVLHRPTIFPMATGYGLMAEDGPEAAMPLTRTRQGYLGVRAVGGDGQGGGGKTDLVFHIVNNTSAPIGQAKGRQISDREFLIELDEAVAGLIDGNGKSAAAVSRRSGTRPPSTVR